MLNRDTSPRPTRPAYDAARNHRVPSDTINASTHRLSIGSPLMTSLSQRASILLICLLISGAAWAASPNAKTTSLLYPTSGEAYIIQLSHHAQPALPKNYDDLLRFHYFGICWGSQVEESLKYAKQMGYSYVFFQHGMEIFR